jgi:predicted nucleic acid-binding Zn ribbon protein
VNRWCKKRCGVIAKKNTTNKKTFMVFFMVKRYFIFCYIVANLIKISKQENKSPNQTTATLP